jgi:hypothetical protein
MLVRWTFFLLIAAVFLTQGFTQELCISTAGKTYAPGEQVWVNMAVLHASTIPGAYKVQVSYDPQKLSFSGILPAGQGPFSITPAASSDNGLVTVAGFQGIVDTGNSDASLATLVFLPANGSVDIDTASFSVKNKEVFSAHAEAMDLRETKLATSVLLPAPDRAFRGKITVANNYVRFAVPNDGLTSVHLYDLNGRVCAVPLSSRYCKAGYHALPLGNALRSGIYIIALRGVGCKVTEKLEVVQ